MYRKHTSQTPMAILCFTKSSHALDHPDWLEYWSMNTNVQKTCTMDNLQWVVHVRYAVHGPRATHACNTCMYL